MLKRWTVARRIACIGGPTGFLDEDEAVSVHCSRRQAQKLVSRRFYKKGPIWEMLFTPGDEFFVRRYQDGDMATVRSSSSYVVPGVSSPFPVPIHPSARKKKTSTSIQG